MRGPLFFFEAWESDKDAELQVCRKTMRALFKRRITPLPFAATLKEFDEVLQQLALRQTTPSIFVINTFWAENLLGELDARMGEAPALFFRRGLSADKAALIGSNEGNTSVVRGMKPRLAAVWGFGAKNTDEVSELAAQCLAQFLADGNFNVIEKQSRFALKALPRAGMSGQGEGGRH
jgi:hypothetical protein